MERDKKIVYFSGAILREKRKELTGWCELTLQKDCMNLGMRIQKALVSFCPLLLLLLFYNAECIFFFL